MIRSSDAFLLNDRGRVTLHRLAHVELRECVDGSGLGYFPMYRCLATDSVRQFGCVRPDVDKCDLERLFGPLVECEPPDGCYQLLARAEPSGTARAA